MVSAQPAQSFHMSCLTILSTHFFRIGFTPLAALPASWTKKAKWANSQNRHSIPSILSPFSNQNYHFHPIKFIPISIRLNPRQININHADCSCTASKDSEGRIGRQWKISHPHHHYTSALPGGKFFTYINWQLNGCTYAFWSSCVIHLQAWGAKGWNKRVLVQLKSWAVTPPMR